MYAEGGGEARVEVGKVDPAQSQNEVVVETADAADSPDDSQNNGESVGVGRAQHYLYIIDPTGLPTTI